MYKEFMPPPPLPMNDQRVVIRERLRLLSLGYYISGAIGAVLVSFLLIHLTFLTILSSLPQSTWEGSRRRHQDQTHSSFFAAQSSAVEISKPPNEQNGPPVFIFKIMAGVLAVVILTGWTLGGLTIYAGRCISGRKHRTFVLIMAGINCIWIPYGTLLGIATFLTLPTPEATEEFPS